MISISGTDSPISGGKPNQKGKKEREKEKLLQQKNSFFFFSLF